MESLLVLPPQQRHNKKTRMHKNPKVDNTIAIRTAKLESREVIRLTRKDFRLRFSMSAGSARPLIENLSLKYLNIILQSAPKERQYLGPAKDKTVVKSRCVQGISSRYLQALKDQVIRHSGAQVDPCGSPGTFQNSTWNVFTEVFV